MTGPEHYRKAEQLLRQADVAVEIAAQQDVNGETLAAAVAMLHAEAQVHATLARVAVAAEALESVAWDNVIA